MKGSTLHQPKIDALFAHGFSLHQQGLIDQARAFYEQVIERKPRHFDALHLLGVLAAQSKNPAQAIQWIGKAIKVNPGVAAAHSNLGAALKELGRFDEAVASYDKAIRLMPDMAEPYSNRGNVLQELGRLNEAIASYDRAISLKPDYADAHFNRGNALKNLMRFDEALASYERAIELRPGLAEAYCNRGIVLHECQRFTEALSSYERAIQLRPDYAEAYLSRGLVFHALNQLDEALASYDCAIAIKPNYAEAFCDSGNVLQQLKRMDEALARYGCAVKLKPDYENAYLSIGNAFKELARLDDALAMFDRAIAINPDYAEAYANRGNLFKDLKRLGEALNSYERAIAIKPGFSFLFGTLIHTRHQVCDWDGYETDKERLEAALESRQESAPSFVAATIFDAPRLQRIAAEVWTHSRCPARDTLGPIASRPRKDRIRLGYYSADFHDHATCCLMAELFELHDKDRFELYAFSFGPDTQDAMRKRVALAFDKFIDVRGVSDIAIARMSRELEIDIAIDLKGYTQDSRPGIFSYRCAPVQVNYLGYPGTMGADYIDYLIADETLIPESARLHYSEKIAYLPHSYQVNDTKRVISDRAFTRSELGLPTDGFVFCCFNNNFKITPQTFDRWMRILKSVEGSVLWLLEDNPHATRNLKKEAAARGVDPGRLIFGGRLALPEHLARQNLADLFLDTLPCNAHTTASDALWAGLPVLTLIGNSFAGRVAASLLGAMELPELIATTAEDYERLAIELASDPSKLGAIKDKIATNRMRAPLYNTALFTRHLEKAYTQMHERYLDGWAPDHLFVSN